MRRLVMVLCCFLLISCAAGGKGKTKKEERWETFFPEVSRGTLYQYFKNTVVVYLEPGQTTPPSDTKLVGCLVMKGQWAEGLHYPLTVEFYKQIRKGNVSYPSKISEIKISEDECISREMTKKIDSLKK